MKIVYVNDILYGYATGDSSAKGGAERYGWHLTRALAEVGRWGTVRVHYYLDEGKEQKLQ